MLDRLLKFEEHLARLEARLLVFFVLFMLFLATYNVFYRNVLVPIQVDLLTREPEVTEEQKTSPTPEKGGDEADPGDGAGSDDGADGFGGGFGGGFDEAQSGDDPTAGFGGGFEDGDEGDEGDEDGVGGFAGGFGDAESPAAEQAGSGEEDTPGDGDSAGGFAGGFGDAEEGSSDGDDAAGGFAGGFGDSDEGEQAGAKAAEERRTNTDVDPAPQKEPPALAEFIDKIKLEWIDVVLRQLVLLVGFLGAMLATRRRKHITIDALSKIIPDDALHWAHVVTNLVALIVCVLLAAAGAKLVDISIEYPKEIVSWAMEWHFQLVFPIGFGLLVLHFGIRIIESFYFAMDWAEPPEESLPKGGGV